jgi:arginine:ornithine antiporter / lysine permease
VRGAMATIYAAGMIYAGGMKFLLLSAVLYAPGTLLYFVARREQKERIFTPTEMVFFVVVALAAVAAVVALSSGAITV